MFKFVKIFNLIITTLCVLAATSCDSEIENDQLEIQSSDFKNYLTLNREINYKISESNLPSKFRADQSNFENQLTLELLKTELKFNSVEELSNFFNLYLLEFEKLENKYHISNFNTLMWENLYIQNFWEIPERITCKQAYAACQTKVVAETVAIETGCLAADLTVIVGIACHVGGFVYEVAGLIECKGNYDACLKL